jgi:hypothetical protein
VVSPKDVLIEGMPEGLFLPGLGLKVKKTSGSWGERLKIYGISIFNTLVNLNAYLNQSF